MTRINACQAQGVRMSNLQPLDVSVCILNRDQKALLKACLESCLAEFARSTLVGEVIVVDAPFPRSAR